LEFAVINADDAYAEEIIAELNPTVALWTFGKKLSGLKDLTGLVTHHVSAQNITCLASGIQFDASCNGETAHINSGLFGLFNVENMLAVLTTLLASGLNLTEAAEKVSNLKSVIGRMEHFGGGSLPSVFVDYAHTPDALEKLLQSVKKHNPQSISLVFGCGGNRDTGKRPIMGQIASQLADKVIVTDDNPRFEAGDDIVSDILIGCQSNEVKVIRGRALAIQTAILQADKKDCVVIAGKGHEDYQEHKGVKMPFSDQAVVKQALKMWGKSCN
jgi:UDP-N-acetylmuramoyl-L-alanyl-D-glutamate--2,6-diaminopimelate ligase